jgi:hypothetical protein
MTRSRTVACAALFLLCVLPICAQEPATTTNSVVPTLVRFSGVLVDPNGKPMTGVVGVTFYLYKDAQSETPLWMETQNVRPYAYGRYSVQLGSTKPNGLPTDVFASGEARWLGVQVQGQPEQPRVLLLSVPYALKAEDAETIGGLPPSAFVLAAPPSAGATAASGSSAGTAGNAPPPSGAVTGTGTVNKVPLWDTTSDIISSVISQSGTGSTAKIGINASSPTTTLDVDGAGTIRGALTLPTTGTATATAGRNSQPLNLMASVFNSGTGTAVSQNFRWQAEPVSNDTSSASGSLNLLYASGSNTLTETGLSFASNGVITFVSAQTFPNVSATGQLISTAAQGTAPLQISSTTQVSNLNANFLGGFSASAFQPVGSYATLGSNNFGDIQNVSANSSLAAVSANNFGTGDGMDGFTWGTTNNFGVMGVNEFSAAGAGVYGVEGTQSTTGHGRGSAGVWGDAGNHGLIAVLATADNAGAILAINNSLMPSLEVANNNSAPGATVFLAEGSGGSCQINAIGGLLCSGSKSAVVPVDGGSRKVALYAVEAPENWFEDAGSGQLSNGAVVINLESIFAQTVNADVEYHVFLTPKNDCEGLYVSNETSAGFEVHELRGGHSNVPFDYRIMARRKGYESIRLADMTDSFKLSKLNQENPQQVVPPKE